MNERDASTLQSNNKHEIHVNSYKEGFQTAEAHISRRIELNETRDNGGVQEDVSELKFTEGLLIISISRLSLIYLLFGSEIKSSIISHK